MIRARENTRATQLKMSQRLVVLSTLVASVMVVLVVCLMSSELVSSEQIQLSTVMPKLQAIHEDTKNLLLKNSELKAKIQAGAKVQQQVAGQPLKNLKAPSAGLNDLHRKAQPAPSLTVSSVPKPVGGSRVKSAIGAIDYMELEEFNEWVDLNLDYAVKNTKASIDALKDEAQQNNGTIEYSEQAVQDGIEGVRYWQSAVIFQDKTLKNEKFDVED